MKKSSSLEFFVLLAILVCLAMIRFPLLKPFYHVPFDNSPSLSHNVKSILGMDLLDLEHSLALTRVIKGNEPFMLTYTMPLKVDAASMTRMGGYYPDDESARRRLLVLLDNGKEADAYEIDRQTNDNYQVKWNTTFASYGDHVLQIRLYFSQVRPRSVDGPKRNETVTNIIQWEYDGSGFGRRTNFRGFLHVPSADYSIQIFDTNNFLMKRIDGHTDNGMIDEFWDSHPTNKYAWTDEDLQAEVYITPTITDTNGQVRSNAPTIRVPYP